MPSEVRLQNVFDLLSYLFSCCCRMAKRVCIRNQSGWVSRLWLALEYNDTHTIKQLIQHGCDINHVFREHGHQRKGLSPILIAVSKNYKDLVRILIESGCNLEQVDAYGETALFVACRRGKLPLLKYLVDSGVNINHLNNKGENVLFIAIQSGRTDLVQYLTMAGIDVDVVNNDGCTPLLHAIDLMDEGHSCTRKATRRTAPSNMVEISEKLIPLSSNLNYNHPNKGAALIMTLGMELKHSPENLRISRMLMQHGAVPDGLFFLRFGGLQAATSRPNSQFFTPEFFGLALDAGASVQKEKTWILTVFQQMPQELQPYEQLFEDLLARSMMPLSLQTICQLFIRARLSGKLWKKIDSLPLPSTLKDYLKLKYVPSDRA